MDNPFAVQRGEVKTEAQRQRERIAFEVTEVGRKVVSEAQRHREEVAAEAQRAKERAEQQAKETQEAIHKRALESQAIARKQQSEAERQAELAKARAREAKRIEQRKRDLPITRPRELGVGEFIARVEKTRKEAHAKGRSARADIEKQKAGFLKGIDKAKVGILADIDKQLSGIEAKIAKSIAEAELAIAAQKAIQATEIDEWEAINLKELNKAEKGYADAIAASMAEIRGIGLSGEQIFNDMQRAGDIPSNAVFKGYETAVGTMGKVSYVLPDTRSGKQIFNDMQRAGDIPSNAVFVGYTPTSATAGDISYSLPETMTPREQFNNWKASDPTAPSDAVYKGESADGGFVYSSPSTMQVEVETAKGKVKMPLSEWEATPEIKQYELVLGRPPTLAEWQGYRLMKGGIDLPWWKELIPGAAGFIGSIASLIPGEIEEERYNKVRRDAHHEWQAVYPELKWAGVGIGILEELGFSAAKAMYPQITVKDVTGKEWAMTGLNIALWALPVWLPKVVKGVKVLIPNKLTARLRTVPFSEKPGLGKAPVAVTTKTIGATQVGMTEAQFSRFVKARVANPKLTPDLFKVLESMGSKIKAVTIPTVKRIKAKPLTGLPKYTYPHRVGVKELTKAEWLGKWKPSAVQATFPAPELVPPGWIKTASGQYMPAGVKPISLPDVPIGLVIRSPIITGTGKVITPVTANQVIKSLGLTKEQIAGTQSLTKTQLVTASRLLGVSQPQVATIAKQGKLSLTMRQHLTALQSKLEGLTATQAATLMKSLTTLQTKGLTQAQMQSLAKTLNLNQTEVQSLLKNVEELHPVAQQALQEFQGVSVKIKPTIKPVTKTPVKVKPPTKKPPTKKPPVIPKIKANGRFLSKKELVGAVAWKQGFIYKLVYPPYGEKDIIHSRKPFPGVKTARGPQSAYKTVSRLGIKLPASIKRDMGIMDIEILTPQKGRGQPKITFAADIKQESWHLRGKRVKSRRFINRKRTDRHQRRLQQTASVGG